MDTKISYPDLSLFVFGKKHCLSLSYLEKWFAVFKLGHTNTDYTHFTKLVTQENAKKGNKVIPENIKSMTL